jgi:hypothetical protein
MPDVFVEQRCLFFQLLIHLVLIHNFYVPFPVFDIYNMCGPGRNSARCAYGAEPQTSDVLSLTYFPLPICMMVKKIILGIIVPFLCLMMLLDLCA